MNSVGVVSVEDTVDWLFQIPLQPSPSIFSTSAPLQLATVAEATQPIRYNPARLIWEGYS